MKRTLVAAVITSLLPVSGALAQRIDLGITGFEALPESEVRIAAPYVVVTTASPLGGGAERCIDFQGQGPVTGFGGTGFVPSRLPSGAPNVGRGGIGFLPYTGPGCTGAELEFIPAAPPLGDSTPRDVEFEMAFHGSVPAAARSGRFVILLAAGGPNPFQLCFRNGWLDINRGPAGAPDLDPEVTVFSTTLGYIEPLHEPFLRLQRRIQPGDTLPRGQYVALNVDVTNRGTAPAIGWRVVITAPNGWAQPRGLSFFVPDCSDFEGTELLTHQGAPLAPGATRRLCAYMSAAVDGQRGVQVWIQTFVQGDSNPGNDSALGPVMNVEAQRDPLPIPPLILRFGGGRR